MDYFISVKWQPRSGQTENDIELYSVGACDAHRSFEILCNGNTVIEAILFKKIEGTSRYEKEKHWVRK